MVIILACIVGRRIHTTAQPVRGRRSTEILGGMETKQDMPIDAVPNPPPDLRQYARDVLIDNDRLAALGKIRKVMAGDKWSHIW